jgi:hypothetical protein
MKPQASNLTLYPIITRELKFFAVDDELESTLYQEIPTVHLGNEMQRDGNQTTLREKKTKRKNVAGMHKFHWCAAPRHQHQTAD